MIWTGETVFTIICAAGYCHYIRFVDINNRIFNLVFIGSTAGRSSWREFVRMIKESNQLIGAAFEFFRNFNGQC